MDAVRRNSDKSARGRTLRATEAGTLWDGTARRQSPSSASSLFLVPAPVVAVASELRPEAAERDVLETERGIRRADDGRRGERLIAVVVEEVRVRAEQARPLEVDARQTMCCGKGGH